MSLYLPRQVGEFFAAVTKSYSYNPIANIYIWFGILWGLPIPLVTIVIQAHFLLSTGVSSPYLRAMGEPLQWFFLAHPLMFGIVFGILGTIRYEKDREINWMLHKLEELSTLDPLTGLKNRRAFTAIYQEEVARSQRRGEHLTLLFLDLDHFKHINDTHGHRLGDLALQETAKLFKSTCRPYDTVARWGGEEFIILLRATDEDAALRFALRIGDGVRQTVSEKLPFTLTVSIGLAQYREHDSLEDITNRADRALYHAKETGRDRVVAWSQLATK